MIEIVPRSEIGAPTPPSSRRRHPVPCWHLLVHYTGAGTYGDGRRADLAEAKAIAAYGVSAGKPYEYNYLVGWQGHVYQQAGEYIGQHCLNFNTPSIGVLLMLGIDVVPSPAMVDAFRQLRAQLPLHPDHECVPHYRYRSTSCCAQAAGPKGARWSSPTGEGNLGDVNTPLLVPWAPYQPQEDDMRYRLFSPHGYYDTLAVGPGVPFNPGSPQAARELVDNNLVNNKDGSPRTPGTGYEDAIVKVSVALWTQMNGGRGPVAPS